jgi:hypothetical protein
VHADPAYVQLLDEILDLHYEKSAGYGTDDDLYANYTAVAAASGEPAWRYPRRRAIEKLTRIESLEAQRRVDEIEEEHLDVASLIICAEVLRRRAHRSTSPAARAGETSPSPASHSEGAPSSRGAALAADLPLIGLTTIFASAEPGHLETGLSGDDEALTLFAGHCRNLADQVQRLDMTKSPANRREVATVLRAAADLIGPEALAKGPYVAPCARGPERVDRASPVMATAHTPCKPLVFASDQTAGEMLRSRIEARAGQDTTGVGRHTPSPAREPARLRDAQRGDDGWVRA